MKQAIIPEQAGTNLQLPPLLKEQPKYMKRFILLFLVWALLMPVFQGLAQQKDGVPIGSWRVHLPNNQANTVADAGDKIYCATEYGLFYFDKEYGNITRLSRADGLNDARISTIGYDEQTKTLLIAYQNANIDLIRDNTIINVNEILRTAIPGAKTINHVYFRNRIAYLACSFGVVVLDLVKFEVKDTYKNIGPNGQILDIYASTTFNDSLFLATSNGVMAGKLSQNLLDFNNWRTFGTNKGLPPVRSGHAYRSIITTRNGVFAGVEREDVYQYRNGQWSAIGEGGSEYYKLQDAGTGLLISKKQEVVLRSAGSQREVFTDSLIREPKSAIQDNAGDIWIADYGNGLLHFSGRTRTVRQLLPDGPSNSSVFSLYADNESVLLIGGGYLSGGVVAMANNLGFDEFKDGEWRTYGSRQFNDTLKYPEFPDIVSAARARGSNKLYLASYGRGLLEWSGPGNFKVYNNFNSPLVSAIPGNPHYVRLGDVAADAQGNIWITNRNEPVFNVPSLHVLRKDGTWQSYVISPLAQGSNVLGLVIDDNGYKWMAVAHHASNGGIFVYDDKNNQSKFLSQNLPDAMVNTMVKDLSGDIWVGTNKGVAVYANTSQVFRSETYGPRTPIVERRPLLEGQVVRTIAVDGGNRKWIGTDAGVWLFNDDGDEAIASFTTKNSPLLSDKITDITVNHRTGEVFIGTDAGLISYRGTATLTEGKPECTQVFPNPVRPGFSGLVGISGLPNNAQVKITDVSGKLVYETEAAGGSAAWNLADYNGRRVKAGVYLVLSANADGSEHCISKIAVIE